jgi:putative hydrolase of the HAD superfamily
VDPALVAGVSLLCLDAGNTVIFLEHARLARLAGEVGFATTAERLIAAEGEFKRLAETGELVDVPWSGAERPGARSWGRTVATILARAGMPVELAPRALEHVWPVHVAKNLWCVVPEGLGLALDALRARGGKVCIVSNSEGMLEELFASLGVLRHFDAVVDSAKVGVEKPDPRIFRIALERFGKTEGQAIHLGDMFATDIAGARAAGIRTALIDPYDHYAGRHLDVPRVPGAVAVAEALCR